MYIRDMCKLTSLTTLAVRLAVGPCEWLVADGLGAPNLLVLILVTTTVGVCVGVVAGIIIKTVIISLLYSSFEVVFKFLFV